MLLLGLEVPGVLLDADGSALPRQISMLEDRNSEAFLPTSMQLWPASSSAGGL